MISPWGHMRGGRGSAGGAGTGAVGAGRAPPTSAGNTGYSSSLRSRHASSSLWT